MRRGHLTALAICGLLLAGCSSESSSSAAEGLEARLPSPPLRPAKADESNEQTDGLGEVLRKLEADSPRRVHLKRISMYGDRRVTKGVPAAGGVRVAMYFDGFPTFRREDHGADATLPKRLYLDVHDAAPAPFVPPVVPVGTGGLLRVRTTQPRFDVMRVVFDLAPQADAHVFFLNNPDRIIVDIDPTADAKAHETGAHRRANDLRVVVIDPGHGGNDYGARYEGMKESQLAMDIARRVTGLLEQQRPELEVLLTRNRDVVLSLDERVAFANAVSADVFVSIHLNAADDPVEHGGVATFVLDTSNDRQALRLAARENGTTTAEVSGLQRILASLHREGQAEASRELASSVQRATLGAGRALLPQLPDRGVKSAMFYVLVGARMPAVLVEASFLTQPDEARLLRSTAYRQALAAGIASGILDFGPSRPR